MANEKLADLVATLTAAEDRKKFNKIEAFKAYPKQALFFELGKTMRERLFMAGNQLGKTEAGAVETAYHLTGRYPKGWKGRRFTKPVKAWACCKTAQLVRDGAQEKLCGAPGVEAAFGTGYIPRADFVDKPSLGRGISDGYDTIQVQHYHNGVKDGISILRFKTYDQGRQKFQGDTLDFIWLDEECPIDIYGECLARITATNGFLFMTFTPLLGKSAVVMRFMEQEAPDRVYLQMRIDEVGHLTPERIAQIMAAYAPHERGARLNGVPKLGDGAIFPYDDELIVEPRIQYVPDYWFKIWGVDFGIEHPFAAVLIAIDRDADCYHVLHTVRIADQLPIQHAAAMKRIAGNAPVAWPHDGENREKGTGQPLAAMYKKEGLKMLPSHATWPTGGYATEPGINMMQGLMTQGRFKVAADLSDWLEEKRNYHRKDGNIVKVHDDLLSATRIAIMQQRSAQPIILGPPPVKTKGGNAQRADGADDEGSYFGY